MEKAFKYLEDVSGKYYVPMPQFKDYFTQPVYLTVTD